jgi:subtilisin family serine protease
MTSASHIGSGLVPGEVEPLQISDDWRLATGRDVTVAIIDSGIDASHPDLDGKIVESVEARVDGKRVVFEPCDAGDSAGHGTACAGIVTGIASDAKIYSVKVLGAGGPRRRTGVSRRSRIRDQQAISDHQSESGNYEAAVLCSSARSPRPGVSGRMRRGRRCE